MKNFRLWVLVIVFVSMCIVRSGYSEGKLNITVHNNTGTKVVVLLWSLDNNGKFNGRPVNFMGAELKAGKIFVMQPRKHNKSPYRYLVIWEVVKTWGKTESRIFGFKADPSITNVLINSSGVTKS